MVVLNRIYTRTGDTGTTALAAGGRRSKHDLRIEAYGTVDETNACLGLVRLHTSGDALDGVLGRIQNDLFDLGSDLATVETGKPLPYAPLRISQGQVDRLDRASHVELGFPHEFYGRDMVNGLIYGGLRDRIDV